MDGFDNIGEILREHYKVFIILIVIIFIVLGIMISKSFWALMPEEGKARVERVSSLKFDSLMEIFEYYECKYKSTVYANQTGYEPMINASLRLPPSEGNIVNEEFYMSLLNDVALFLDYKNFIISDETRSLKVEVQCENAQIKKNQVNKSEGQIALSIVNKNIIENEFEDIKELVFDGTLLKTAKVNLEDIKFKVSFDIVIVTKKNREYKANLCLDLPIGNILENGFELNENVDISQTKFEKVK
jgi:hypothetical protein